VLQVQKQQKGDLLVVSLKGGLDETVDLNLEIGNTTPPRIDFVMKEVVRINSQGIKVWLRYLQSLQGKVSTIRLLDCSAAVVEAMNSISNFASGAIVESVYVPFFCKDCRKEFLGLFRVGDIKKLALKIPDLNCPSCQGGASFDDVEKEYFYFITRSGK